MFVLQESSTRPDAMNRTDLAPNLNSSSGERYDQNTRPTLPPIRDLGILPDCLLSSPSHFERKVYSNGLMKTDSEVTKYTKSDKPHRTALTFEDVFGTHSHGLHKTAAQPLRGSNIKVVYVQEQDEPIESDEASLVCESEDELLYDPDEAVGSSLWSQYMVDLGKEKGKGPSIFECTFPVANGTEEICKYRGLKQSVKRHINAVHLKQRPWVCLYCFKRFPQKTTAGVHIGTIHSKKEKWLHPCEYCHETFKDPARRYKHTKEVHPEQSVKTRRKDPYAHIEAKGGQLNDDSQMGVLRFPGRRLFMSNDLDSPRSSSSASSGYSGSE